MKREYLDRSVYDAVQDRFDYLFQEFENIYVSFSGGKDSGLLLNLLMDYKRAHYPHRVIGLFTDLRAAAAGSSPLLGLSSYGHPYRPF